MRQATNLTEVGNLPITRLRPACTYPVLIVAENLALRKILRRLFSIGGFEVEVVADGLSGLELLRQRSFSAVILDLKHPVSAGSDLCRKIADSISAPLVLLSASSNIADRRLLLETGADDYLTIPFSPKELITRTGALIQRSALIAREDLFAVEDVATSFPSSEITRLEIACALDVETAEVLGEKREELVTESSS
jgi:DNA-binding response OmpR family regulator